MTKQNVALVAGSTGIVGEAVIELLSKPDTPGGPWKTYGLARRARPDWLSPEEHYVQCDLLNRGVTLAKISPLTDVTHLFWVTWVARATEAENCADNGKMFQNALDALLPNAKDLQHIALQTGGKHYMGPFESGATGPAAGEGDVIFESPFTEDLPRQPIANFYYTLEDILFEAVEQKKGKLTWSVHRPGMILGIAAGNLMNFLGSIAVYGAICKHEGLPFAYPGNQFTWDNAAHSTSNSDLIAEQEVWAATDRRGKNQAFNTVNGDLLKFKKVWKSLAEKLGVEYVPYSGKPALLAESMKDMGPVWDSIVQKNGLYPSKLEQVGQWWFVDWTLSINNDVQMCMNKSKEHGFLGFRNTSKTILSHIDRMRERKLIPL